MAKKKTTKVAATAANDAEIVKESILDNLEEGDILVTQPRQTLDNLEEGVLVTQLRQTRHDLEEGVPVTQLCQTRRDLVYLLFLEKAAGVICRKYENLAKAYPGTYHDLSFGEYDDKYMKFSGIYNKIIEKIENTLIDWEEKEC